MSDLKSRVEIFEEDVDLTHQLVQGDDSTSVTTVNGDLPSFAKLQRDLKEDALNRSEYEYLGDYAAGLQVDYYYQLIRAVNGDGVMEFWRPRAETTLPYITTGAGMPESGAFAPVGDATLRGEISGGVRRFEHLSELKKVLGRFDGDIADMLSRSSPLYALSYPYDGGGGVFGWSSENLSSEVSSDPQEGVYIPPNSDPTGASGAWIRRELNTLIPEQFGVDGSASPSDFAGWQGLFSFHLASGIPVKFQKKTYLFDPATNGVLRVGISDGQSILVDANGATLKFVDAMPNVAGAFWHMILFASGGIYSPAGATVEKIEFKNAVLDGNFRGQPAPTNPSDYEQRAAVKVIIEASSGNRCKDVYFYNITQVDPVADTLQFGPSTSSSVNGEAAINNLTIDKFHAGVRTGVRAAIQIGSQAGRINISNVTRDMATGPETNSIETEFSAIGAQKVEMNLCNVHIDDIELGCPAGREDQFQINMVNVHTYGFFLCVGGSVSAINSNLRIALTNTQRIKRFLCENVVFKHAIRDPLGAPYPYTLAPTRIAGGTYWKLSNCFHVVEGAVDQGRQTPLFSTSNMPASEVDDHVFEFSNVWFDPSAPTSIDCYAGGTVKTSNCTIGGFYRGVVCGGFSRFGSKWISDGDDFRAVTGSKFVVANPLNSEVWFGTQVTNDFGFSVLSIGGETIIKSSCRVMQADSTPTGGGVVGDIVTLSASAYDAAASGDPVSWKCIRSNKDAAIWVPMVNKP